MPTIPDLVIGLSYPDAWQPDAADEVQYRLAHGKGNARLVYVIRDAVLSAPLGIPLIPSATGINARAGRPDRAVTVNFGPAGRDKLAAAALHEWNRAAFARSALRYYLDLPLDARPRNLLGSDPYAEVQSLDETNP